MCQKHYHHRVVVRSSLLLSSCPSILSLLRKNNHIVIHNVGFPSLLNAPERTTTEDIQLHFRTTTTATWCRCGCALSFSNKNAGRKSGTFQKVAHTSSRSLRSVHGGPRLLQVCLCGVRVDIYPSLLGQFVYSSIRNRQDDDSTNPITKQPHRDSPVRIISFQKDCH